MRNRLDNSAAASRAMSLFAWRRCEILLLAVLVIPLFIVTAGLIYRSTLLAQINYNEGWNAYFVSFVESGKPLYYPRDALLTNNYPPLSFFIIAPAAALIGDAVFAGRLIAWVAFIAIVAIIAAIVGRLSGDRFAAAFGTTVFAGYMITNYDIYVGMNDPQMLAHAVIMLGLYVYLRWSDAPWSSAVAAVVIAVGLFIKHNIIGLPIALALWMFVYDRRSCWRFVFTGVLTAVLGLALCRAAFGPDFMPSLLEHRPFIPQRGWRHVIEWTYPMELPLVLAGLGSVITPRDRYSVLFFIYVLASLVVAYSASGGDGVNFNIMFEVVISFSLAAGVLLAHLDKSALYGLRAWAICAYAFAALVGGGVVANKDVILIRPWLAEQRAREQAARSAIDLMSARPGPAFCMDMALCYWAGKPFELDPLNFAWGVEAGTKDIDAVLRRIETGYYSTIEFSRWGSFLPPPVAAAVKNNYRPIAGPIALYVRP